MTQLALFDYLWVGRDYQGYMYAFTDYELLLRWFNDNVDDVMEEDTLEIWQDINSGGAYLSGELVIKYEKIEINSFKGTVI